MKKVSYFFVQSIVISLLLFTASSCQVLQALDKGVKALDQKLNPDKYPETVALGPGKKPCIPYGQDIPYMVWNDPSVLKENGVYRMWVSGGSSKELPDVHVRVFHATSTDGINWKIGKDPVLSNGSAGEWDSQSTETPAVVKAGNTYHLYYSGCQSKDCLGGRYKIGHATSPDGINWTKDKNNPVISYHSDSDPLRWGFYTTAEPGIIYDERSQKFFLYYATVKGGRPGYEGDLGAYFGIAMATSSDGSIFKKYDPDADGHDDVVLMQSASYPVTKKYIGYSTPYAFLDSMNKFHLFYDVVQYPNKGDFRQVALAHAVSNDGINLTEVQADIETINSSSSHNYEVRAPAVIEEGSVFKLWYAGTGSSGYASTGIYCRDLEK